MLISKEQHRLEMQQPDILRSCYNCSWLKSALHYWCTNKQAQKNRGTSIPGCIHCPHWEPDMSAQRKIAYNKIASEFMIVD
jgi:hypothetical protein